LLRLLLVGPIKFTPFHENGRRGYRFVGCASIGGLLEGLVDECNGNWRPHRDSNPGFSLERAASYRRFWRDSFDIILGCVRFAPNCASASMIRRSTAASV